MRRRSVIASIGAIVGTSVGAAAYTSATVTRDASFTVSADNSGSTYIGLTAGTTSGVTNTGDKLVINPSNLNTDGSFTFGAAAVADTDTTTSDIGSDYAFSITNNDTGGHSLTVSFDTAGVSFDIWQQGTDWTDASSIGSVDSTTSQTVTLAAGEAARVVMTIDTTGVASGTSSGTLTFTAN